MGMENFVLILKKNLKVGTEVLDLAKKAKMHSDEDIQIMKK